MAPFSTLFRPAGVVAYDGESTGSGSDMDKHMRITATVATTTELQLSPKVQKRLKMELEEYARLDTEYKAAKLAREAQLAAIEDLRETIDQKSFKFDGATITRVEGTSSRLDKKKLISLGCAAAWLEEATMVTPKKAYTKVTLPGEPEKPYGED